VNENDGSRLLRGSTLRRCIAKCGYEAINFSNQS
jgi:hypothetical protein